MIAGCLLTAILIVVPAQPGMEHYFPGQWLFSQVALAGLCNEIFGRGEMFVEDRKLIILYVGEKYIIPFPPKVGHWPMAYWIGSEFADMGATWGRVMVRRGPMRSI